MNMQFDMDDHFISFQVHDEEIKQLLCQIQQLTAENSVLKTEILEAQSQVEIEVCRRNEVQENVNKVLNSPGAATDQLLMWSEKVRILEQITDLQSSLIDKNFILKQSDVIKDLHSALDAEPDIPVVSPSAATTVSDVNLNFSSTPTHPGDTPNDLPHAVITADDTSINVSSSTFTSYCDDHVTLDNITTDSDIGHANVEGKIRPPKFHKHFTHVIYNSNIEKPAPSTENKMDLHVNDQERVKRFDSALHRMSDLPQHVDTVVITDSNGHKVKSRQLDPMGRTWVLSSGGLCINATVHSLQSLNENCSGITKVVYSLGLNDELHKRQHVKGERGWYLSALGSVTNKIFPNSSMSFVLPFTGGKVSKQSIGSLKSDIVKYLPNTVIHSPPGMEFGPDGVHLNATDLTHFRRFLKEKVVRQPTIFSSDSGKRSEFRTSYSGSLGLSPWCTPFNAQPHSDSYGPRSPTNHRDFFNSSLSPISQSLDKNLVAEITNQVVSELLQRKLLV